MVRSVFLLVCLLPLYCLGQANIGKNKETIKKDLESWKMAHAGYAPKITEATGSTTLSFKDPGYGQLKVVYNFSKTNECISEKTIALNDSARSNYLNIILEQKGYDWLKLNGNQYISSFDKKMMIEIPGNPKDFSVTVYHVDWNRDIYDMLLKK